MGFINLAEKTIHAKLVYYGIGAGGKTTSLKAVHSVLCPANEVKLVSINTEEDATLLFDFLPINLGHVEGFKIVIQGFTVPGQPKYRLMRKYVLQGADAVVLVVDSQSSRLEENIQALKGLQENLLLNGLDPATIPVVVQYNKRDLDDILGEEEMNKFFLYRPDIQAFPSVATEKQGVFEAFVLAAGLLVDAKVSLYGLGQGDVDPQVVAEGARRRLWEIYDHVRGSADFDSSEKVLECSVTEDPTYDESADLSIFDDIGTDSAAPEQGEPKEEIERLELTEEDLHLDVAEVETQLPQPDFSKDREERARDLRELTELPKIEEIEDEVATLPEESAEEAEAQAGAQAGAQAEVAADLFDEEDQADELVFSDEELDADLNLEAVLEADGETVIAVEEDIHLLDKALQSNLQLAEAFGELDQHKAALARKNEELVKVAQNTVHDLNKPLAAIKLMLSSAVKGLFGELGKNVGAAMDNALVAVRQMERLLEDLMDSSRLDFDGIKLCFKEVDMHLLVADVVRTLRFQIEEKDVGIRITPLPKIRADEWALNKAFMNLIGNAIQYSHPDNAPRVWISHEDAGSYHRFVVKDNGIGIPEARRERLFQRFERGANTAGISGTGLGLHIVKEVVQGHSGYVHVESVENEGATFSIHLPKEPVQAPHSQVSESLGP